VQRWPLRVVGGGQGCAGGRERQAGRRAAALRAVCAGMGGMGGLALLQRAGLLAACGAS
jgi:hypothetical protein